MNHPEGQQQQRLGRHHQQGRIVITDLPDDEENKNEELDESSKDVDVGVDTAEKEKEKQGLLNYASSVMAFISFAN